MINQNQIVITSAFRTAIGSFGGSLATKTAPELGAEVIKKCMKHSQLKADDVFVAFLSRYQLKTCILRTFALAKRIMTHY